MQFRTGSDIALPAFTAAQMREPDCIPLEELGPGLLQGISPHLSRSKRSRDLYACAASSWPVCCARTASAARMVRA
jgi:hypothetical protein